MEEVEHLTVGDAENAASAVLTLVLQYPDFPKTFKATNKTVRWNTTCDDSTSIGIFPLQGARYIKKYVSGNYTAQFPYQIVFRSSPTTNKTSIDAQTVLDSLAAWWSSRTFTCSWKLSTVHRLCIRCIRTRSRSATV